MQLLVIAVILLAGTAGRAAAHPAALPGGHALGARGDDHHLGAHDTKEAARAYRHASEFVREIARVSSIEEMHAVLTAWNTRHVGGGRVAMRPGGISRELYDCRDASGLRGDQWNAATICDERITIEQIPQVGGVFAIISTVMGDDGRERFVGTTAGVYALATPADLLRLRATYRASLQQGVAPHVLEHGNADASRVVRARLDVITAARAGDPTAQALLAEVARAAARERAQEHAERDRAMFEMAANWGYNRRMLTPSAERPGWWNVDHTRKILQPWETTGSP